MAAFVVLSTIVVLDIVLPWDEAVLQWVGTIRASPGNEVMVALTMLGDGGIVVPFALGVVALLWRMGRSQCARRLLLAGVIGEVVYVIAKASFQRPRPRIITHMTGAGWYSYPSGHAMLAPILWSLSLILLARSVSHRWLRRFFHLLSVVIPLGIAVSRVYLGVHYPSDIMAGLLLGTAWTLIWLGVPYASEAAPTAECDLASEAPIRDRAIPRSS